MKRYFQSENPFSNFFNLLYINEEIGSEAQQFFDNELQKICLEVEIDRFFESSMNIPMQAFNISLIKVLSIEIFSEVLGKFKGRCWDDDRELLQSPEDFNPEENLVTTTRAVLELVKLLYPAKSLMQLSVTFVVDELEDEENECNISMIKTLADPFKVLRGINRPRLIGICSLQGPRDKRVKVSVLDESNESFRQYKICWEETLARVDNSSGLSDVEGMYYQLLNNRYDILNATSQLGTVMTTWEWKYCRSYGNLIYDDYLEAALEGHLNTISGLLSDARLARDCEDDQELRGIDEEMVLSFQEFVAKRDDFLQERIEKREQVEENLCRKRRKLRAESFTVEEILTPSQ